VVEEVVHIEQQEELVEVVVAELVLQMLTKRLF